MDRGNNKISYKQNTSGFWRGEFTLCFADDEEIKERSKNFLDHVIGVLNERNKNK